MMFPPPPHPAPGWLCNQSMQRISSWPKGPQPLLTSSSQCFLDVSAGRALFPLRALPIPPPPHSILPGATGLPFVPSPASPLTGSVPTWLASITPLMRGNASSSLLQPPPAWAAGSGEWLGPCRGTFGNWTIPSFLAGSRERWVGVLRRSPSAPSVSPREPGYQSRDL